MKQSGFTLIELLAVIVILAVIALIATPMVMDMIEDTRKAAVTEDAVSLIDKALMNAVKVDDVSNLSLTYDAKDIEINNNKFNDGLVIVDEKGVVTLDLACTDSYCVSGTKDNLVVTSAEENIVKDGLVLWLEGRDFSNLPQSAVWKDRSAEDNDAVTKDFSYTTSSGSDGMGGIVFDGVDDSFYPRNPILSSTDLTVQIVVSVKDTSIYNNLVSSNPPVFVRISPAGIVKYDLYYKRKTDNINTWTFNFGSIVIKPNTINCITLVYDGSKLKGYVNDIMDISVDREGSIPWIGSLHLGYTPVGGENSPFSGTIYSVKIYNCALTDSEVKQNYLATKY
jgi:prepilin-type N-terminal cleavage/methylation domain-containing protein